MSKLPLGKDDYHFLWHDGAFFCKVICSVHHSDTWGVINHTSYICFAEEARGLLFRSFGSSLHEICGSGYGISVRKLNVKYSAPAVAEQDLIIRTQLVSDNKYECELEQRFFDLDGNRKVDIRVSLVSVDLNSLKLAPLNQDFIKLAKEYTENSKNKTN